MTLLLIPFNNGVEILSRTKFNTEEERIAARRVYKKRWKVKNKARYAAHRQDKKARARYEECTCCKREDIISFYENREKGMQVDHIVGARRGGKHCLKNMQYLHIDEHYVKTGLENRK